MRNVDVLLFAAALAGCAATPFNEGGKAEILYARDEVIRIRWNPQLTNERAMRSSARAFCGGRDVDEVDAALDAGASGSLQSKTWRCDPFPGTGAGM